MLLLLGAVIMFKKWSPYLLELHTKIWRAEVVQLMSEISFWTIWIAGAGKMGGLWRKLDWPCLDCCWSGNPSGKLERRWWGKGEVLRILWGHGTGSLRCEHASGTLMVQALENAWKVCVNFCLYACIRFCFSCVCVFGGDALIAFIYFGGTLQKD